ncbi:MAG: type III pantothenate kinase, partial [Anaerolineae bacterium]|nr:type III pantothenate kinase [Anaerolineae bacterium]
MLLALEIGNTNIVIGVHNGSEWAFTWRVQTVRDRMPDEYAVMVRTFLREVGLRFDSFDQTVLSSVVPQLTAGLRDMIAQRTGFPPLIVGHEINTGLRINTDYPQQVGADRIADAVAAYERFRSNCIVVDFGTATAFTIV